MQKKIISQNDKINIINALHDMRQLNLITIDEKNNVLKMLKNNDYKNINIFAKRLLSIEQDSYSDTIKQLLI